MLNAFQKINYIKGDNKNFNIFRFARSNKIIYNFKKKSKQNSFIAFLKKDFLFLQTPITKKFNLASQISNFHSGIDPASPWRCRMAQAKNKNATFWHIRDAELLQLDPITSIYNQWPILIGQKKEFPLNVNILARQSIFTYPKEKTKLYEPCPNGHELLPFSLFSNCKTYPNFMGEKRNKKKCDLPNYNFVYKYQSFSNIKRQLKEISPEQYGAAKGKYVVKYNLETYHRSNQDTCLIQKPAVKVGDWIQTGDLLADSASSVGGELAIGHNIIVAYMPWEGYNYEDAILINERLVYEDIYTSIHIERYEVHTKETNLGSEQITREIPDINENEIRHLDKNGIAKIGSWVEEGDILVGKITPFNLKTLTPQQKLLYKIFDKQLNTTKDSSLRAPKGIKANVINVNILARQKMEINNKEKTDKKPKSKTKTKDNNSSKTLKQVKKGKTQMTDFKVAKLTNSLRYLSNARSFITTTSVSKLNKEIKTPFTGFPIQIKKGFKNQKKGLKPDLKFALQGNEYTLTQNIATRSARSKNNTHFKLGFSPFFSKMLNISTVHNGVNKIQNQTSRNNKSIPSYVHIYLAEKRKMQVGDKMAGRHGNKGIVSRILPRQDMPFLPDGTYVDIVLNPLGVPSRMNVGQIYECLLGLAGRYLGEHYKIPPFDEMYGSDASRSFVLSKLYEARKKTGLKWLFDPNNPGKIRLFDGRNSECFNQTVTVGIAYVLKLVHMVEDKIHMRSTGPYSLVTQQPLRGRSKQGGQRLGEMEVWAIEGYGAAFVLSEMLTIKSDDMTGRQNLWKNLIENKDISLGSPESFKVLICELQALCLDIGLFRKNNSIAKFTTHQNLSNRKISHNIKDILYPNAQLQSNLLYSSSLEDRAVASLNISHEMLDRPKQDINKTKTTPNLIEIDSLLHLA